MEERGRAGGWRREGEQEGGGERMGREGKKTVK